MNVSIKYEQLSGEIKDEITRFHEKQNAAGKRWSIEESMRTWFESNFDSWIETRFAPSDIKRRFHRVDIELPIRVVDMLIESDGDDDSDMDFLGTIVNISKGGLFFKSKRSFELSSIIKVVIDLSCVDPDLSQIEALAMVVRCDSLEGGAFGIGLMFSSVYDDDKVTLDLFIFKNLAYFMYSA
jgi:hypothetical protein